MLYLWIAGTMTKCPLLQVSRAHPQDVPLAEVWLKGNAVLKIYPRVRQFLIMNSSYQTVQKLKLLKIKRLFIFDSAFIVKYLLLTSSTLFAGYEYSYRISRALI